MSLHYTTSTCVNLLKRNTKSFFLLLFIGVVSLGKIQAQSITLTTTVDEVNGTTTSIANLIATPGGAGISLREAIIAANNEPVGSTITINIPAGNITLTLTGASENAAATGDLDITSTASAGTKTINLQGAGASTTTITGSGDRILDIEPSNLSGDLTVNISGLTFTGGNLVSGSGGAILAGFPNNVTNISSCIFSSNTAVSNGGAISQSSGGTTHSLTITNTSFTNNTATGAVGGAVNYAGIGTVSITGCTFSGNTCGTQGGAINISGTGTGPTTTNILRNTFLNNTANGATFGGAAVAVVNAQTFNVNFNRLFNNNAASVANGKVISTGGGSVSSMNLDNNWWGVNTGPAASAILGTAPTRWLRLTNTSSSASLCTGGVSTITASFLTNNLSEAISTANLSTVIFQPIVFNSPVNGTLSSGQTSIQSSGTATVTFTATGAGAGSANAVFAAAVENFTQTTSPTITITGLNTAGAASSTPTLCANTTLTNITHSTTNATGIANNGVSGANGLPAGVAANWAANTITISGTPTATGTFNYSIALTGGCGTVNATGTITVTANTWLGGTSVWNTPGNWCAGVPSSTTDVLIPSGVPNMPNIASGSFAVRNITINSGATLTVAGTLQIAGTISNSGTFTATSGTIEMNGSSAQTIPSGVFATNTIRNLTINNTAGVVLGGTLNITGLFTPTSGAFATGGFLTLKSSSVTNTALVGVVGGSVSGNITIERFIPAKRAYRLLAPGVTTSTSIRANWQEGTNNPNTSTNNNPNAGFGTHITGGTSANGFDVTTTNNPSLYTYNNTTQTWVAAANTGTATLNATTGYQLMVRGDRSINLNSNTPTPTNTILRTTGTITTGNVNFSGLAGTTNQYSLLGNPYWSPVDWTAVTRTNIGTTYWIWDPAIAGTNGRGGYTSFTRTGIGTGTTSGGGAINKNLQPGQAFWVQTTASSPALSFAEANKDVATALTSTFRTNNSSGTEGMFIVKLYLKNNYNKGELADAATVAFDSKFSSTKDEFDAPKFVNPDESISFKNGNSLFGMESRPLPSLNKLDTIHLNMGSMLSKSYIIEVEGKDFDITNTVEAYLIDSYLDTKTKLETKGNIKINYEIDLNPASAAANRFYIVAEKKPMLLIAADNNLEVKLTPNPATEYVQVNYSARDKGKTTIRIIGSNGQTITTVSLGDQQNGQYRVPVSRLASGIYTVEVIVGNDKQTAKLVKQ